MVVRPAVTRTPVTVATVVVIAIPPAAAAKEGKARQRGCIVRRTVAIAVAVIVRIVVADVGVTVVIIAAASDGITVGIDNAGGERQAADGGNTQDAKCVFHSGERSDAAGEGLFRQFHG